MTNIKNKSAKIQSLYTDQINLFHKADTPYFKRKFRVVSDSTGNRSVLEEKNNKVLRPVKLDEVVSGVLQFSRDPNKGISLSAVTFNDAVQIAKYWLATTETFTQQIYPVLPLSDERYTYHRLSFDPVPSTDLSMAPTWEEISSRMTNWKAFCARLASILDPFTDRKQAVFLSGPKDCGKSQISHILSYIAGGTTGAYGTLTNQDLRSNFFMDALVGKRILVVNESSISFINKDAFKSLTGDLVHNINPKNRPMFIAQLPILFWFISNEEPKIEQDPAKLERIIDCRIKPVELARDNLIPETEYQRRLVAELPVFLGYCESIYEPYRGGARIPCCSKDLLDSSYECDLESLALFETYFKVVEGHKLRAEEVFKVAGKGLQSSVFSKHTKVWEDRLGIFRHRLSNESGRSNYYVNLDFNDEVKSSQLSAT